MKKIIFGVLKGVVCVALCLLVFLSGLSFVATAFLDESLYVERIVNDEYVDEIEQILIDHLESDSLFYDIPIDYILAGLNREELDSLSAEYIGSLISSFKSGASIPKIGYNSVFFENEIRRYLSDNPDIGEFYEEETIIEIAQELKLTVDNTLNSFIDIGVIERIVRSVYSNKYIILLSNSFYYLIGAGVLLIALIFALNGKKFFFSIYNVFGSVWCGSTLLFVPAFIIKSNDFLANIVLEKGPFRLLINGIYEMLIERWIGYSSILFISGSIALIISIILLSVFSKVKESDGENEKG